MFSRSFVKNARYFPAERRCYCWRGRCLRSRSRLWGWGRARFRGCRRFASHLGNIDFRSVWDTKAPCRVFVHGRIVMTTAKSTMGTIEETTPKTVLNGFSSASAAYAVVKVRTSTSLPHASYLHSTMRLPRLSTIPTRSPWGRGCSSYRAFC